MTRSILAGAVMLLSALMSPAVVHAEPVKRVAIYVEPFYRSSDAPEGAPEVRTGKPWASLLASTRKEDILTARDGIVADPGLVTPMTLMVLAIRFYDFGLRDEAVMWFYAAKDRHIALTEVIEKGHPLLAQADEAVRAFATLAGPVINGYAFCDVANQQAQRAKAIAWVEANPYRAVFIDKLPSRKPDRKAALAEAVAAIKASAAKESAYVADQKNVAELKATRTKNGADERFCWK